MWKMDPAVKMRLEVRVILLNIPFTRNLPKLQEELEQAIREYLERGFDPYLRVTSEYEKLRLHMDSVVYIEREDRRTVIAMRRGVSFRCYQSLQKLEEQLPPSFFVRISSKTIVNVNYLLDLRPYEVTLQWAGRTITRKVSQRRYPLLAAFRRESFGR